MLKFFLVMIFCTSYLFSLESISNPLMPGRDKLANTIGITGGLNYLLGPSILKDIPNQGSVATQQSLVNNLNGLGYKSTANFGITSRFPITGRFWIGGNLNYSSFTSQNKCNCSGGVLLYNSENTLAIFQISVLPYFYFANIYKTICYIAPEINMNMFMVSVKEMGSRRNTMDFSKTYPRLGLGISLGSEIHLMDKISLDINVKSQALNLFLAKDNSSLTFTGTSQSLINKAGEFKETLITLFQINLGILYSF